MPTYNVYTDDKKVLLIGTATPTRVGALRLDLAALPMSGHLLVRECVGGHHWVMSDQQVLANIAEVLWPGGRAENVDRDALALLQRISDIVNNAGLGPTNNKACP